MDEDIITIHLGVRLSEEHYKQVVQYIIACLNARYSDFTKAKLTTS